MAAHAESLHTEFAFHLSYESRILAEAEAMAAGTGNAPVLADVFAVKLDALEHEERRRGTTLAGPHRDDVAVRLDGKDLRKYGSQGQRRLFAVLLKLAELSHLEKQLQETCVLLLDDVFSEFDRDVMGQLQHLLDGTRQVFVTSPVDLDWAGSENARVYRVHAGTVEVAT
jgi:DNA replication and repair protein RecF